MSALRLVGVTKVADAPRMRAAACTDISVVEATGLAAILAPASKPIVAWLRTRKAAMEEMLAFQRLLESLSAVGPILPAAYGSTFVSQDDARALLRVYRPQLVRDLADFGGKAQFQIDVRWDPARAMAAFMADGRLVGLDRTLAQGDRRAFGAVLQALMEAERQRMGADFRARLAAASQDLVLLPLADETAILNVAALIERTGEAELDAAVKAIDASMPEALTIRYLGPLPALSFASIVVSEQDTGELALSLRRLGVPPDATEEAITAAYRRAMRDAHPDTAGAAASTDAAAALAAAYAIALKAATAPRTAKGAPLLLDICREGEGTGTARRAA